ncbi:MAG: hypothetical protein HY862_12675 [Chloroflexi bacterium]|nr:hypothetical protein [Chloroflexota bacterium]
MCILRVQETDYQLLIFTGADPLDPHDDNVDVEVNFSNGERYVATFFTLTNLETIMNRYSKSGECNNGKYLWATDMVIVRELTPETIRETVAYMILNDELAPPFSRVTNDDVSSMVEL